MTLSESNDLLININFLIYTRVARSLKVSGLKVRNRYRLNEEVNQVKRAILREMNYINRYSNSANEFFFEMPDPGYIRYDFCKQCPYEICNSLQFNNVAIIL